MELGNFQIGNGSPFFLIAGPCVIESEELVLETAGYLKSVCQKLDIPYIFKSSFDKANRSSLSGFRGLGIEKGLAVLERVRNEVGVPVLTDVHEATPLSEVSEVVDVLQTPAFLCRQTDFILRVCEQQKPVNIKKGQFLSPSEMKFVIEKAKSTGNQQIMACERGVSFGYNQLVTDMRALKIMRECQVPIVFDATHSVQQPGALNGASGGNREMVPTLARAALAVGIDGLFMETHPDPDKALSDGPNSVPLARMPELLAHFKQLDECVKSTNMWLD